MIINMNWMVALIGCASLCLFWRWQHASGRRGLLFVAIGCIVILGAVIYQQEAASLPAFVGLLLAVLVFAGLLFWLGRLLFAPAHPAPHYQAPAEMHGRCSAC